MVLLRPLVCRSFLPGLGQPHSLPSFGLSEGLCCLAMCVTVKGWLNHVLNALSILSFLLLHFSVLLGAMDSLNDVKLHS